MFIGWYIPGVLSETGVVGSNIDKEYIMDRDYMPSVLHLRLKTLPEPDGEPLTIDINCDGESIFPNEKPILVRGDEDYKDWTNKVLKKDSVVTLDIDQVSPTTPGKDLTVQLDLEEV